MKKTSAAMTLAASACALTLGAGQAMAASSHSHLAVTPHSHVKNGQQLKVTGSGFPKNTTLYLVECHPKKGTASQMSTGCDLPDLRSFTTRTGKFSVKFKVKTGKIGDGTCNKHHACEVAVSTVSGGSKATVKVTFR